MPAEPPQATDDRVLTNPPPRRRLFSIRAMLAMVVLACVLPALVGGLGLVARFYLLQREQLERDALQTARALALAVDRGLASGRMGALGLATSPSLVHGDVAAFHRQASDLVRQQSVASNFVLSDETGQQLANTFRPYGEVLPHHGNLDQLRTVFRTGRPVVSDVYIGGVARRPLVGIDVPVLRDGKVVYDLTVGFLPEGLGRILTQQRLPPGRVAAIFDTKGVIAARTLHADKYVGLPGAPALVRRMGEADEGVVETSTLEGIPVYSVFSRSAVTGWTVAIGIPKADLAGEIRRSAMEAAAVLAAVLAAGLSLAWAIGGRISRSVSALTAPALALGSGDALQLPEPGFREAEEVGRALATASVVLDHRTAERDQARRQETEAQRLFKAVIDASFSLIYAFDRDGRCLLANEAFAALHSRPPAALVGLTRQTFLTPEEAESHQAPDRKVFLSGRETTVEETLPGPDGTRTYLAVRFPIRDGNGAIQAVGGVATDITERKLAERELDRYRHRLEALVAERTGALEEALAEVRRSEERFRLMTECVKDYAIFMVDPQGQVVTWNTGAERLKGYSAEEIVGRSMTCFYPPEDVAAGRPQALLSEAEAAGRAQDLGWRVRKDGSRFFADVSLSCLRDADGTLVGFTKITRDVSERTRLEEELKRSNADLEQFAYVASHDLRQPLRMISSYLTLIERRYGGRFDDEGREFLAFARDGAISMDRLIIDLLEYSRIGRHGPADEAVDLAEAADEALLALGPVIDEAAATVAHPPGPAAVTGNRTEVVRLLQNLVGNAVKYRDPARAPRIHIGWRRQDAGWQVSVADNGIGIAAEHLADVFKIFRRLHTAGEYEGTGIGLAICQKIVEGHGGRIWVESVPGAGSTFHFTLPAVAAAGVVSPPPSADGERSHASPADG